MSLQTQLASLTTAIGTKVKEIKVQLYGSSSGTLASLQTTDKTSIVAAINEARTTGGAGSPPDASETVKGVAELATQAEVTTGTDDARIVTPLKLATRIAAIPATPAASETVSGIVELATLAEVATGTDSTRAVTAAGVRQERNAIKAEILGAGVPAALDTLDELAAALGDDANFASTVTTSLSNKQPLDADLTAIAALASAADKVPYSTGAQTWALANFTAAGRTLVGAADAAAQRTALAVYSTTEIGNPETDLVAVFNAALV
jgi:hypothetical protein